MCLCVVLLSQYEVSLAFPICLLAVIGEIHATRHETAGLKRYFAVSFFSVLYLFTQLLCQPYNIVASGLSMVVWCVCFT